MRKKLIKKGQGGFALFSNQLMGQSSMNFSQPLTDLNDPMIDKLSSPMGNIKLNKLTTPNLVMKGPDTSKIVSGLNSTLSDTEFQNRMAKGQSNYMKQMKSAQNKQKWGDFKSNIKEFGSSDLGKGMIDLGVNAGLDLGLTALGKESDALDGGVNAIADVAGNFGTWGQVAKYAIKGLNFADKALGKTTKSFSGNTGLSGYQDFSTQGKQFRLSQTKSKNRAELEKNLNQKLFTGAKTNSDFLLKQNQARTQAINNTGLTNQQKLLGESDYSVLTAKNGATLEDIRNYIKTRNIKKEVLQNSKLDEKIENQEINEIQKFQNGGSLIPSGALHKNKHKLESINPELDGEITKKGIPVISYAEKGDILEYEADGETPKVLAEGGEIIQHAEIEKDEVILNLSLTKKLIELMKKDTSEAMIEAGKILARELMEDTTDNTGLLEKTIGNEN